MPMREEATLRALLAQEPAAAVARLAAPTTAVMGVAAIWNVLHTYFMSYLGSEAIAAVSLVFPVALIVTTLMGGGIGAGVSSAVARTLGSSDAGSTAALIQHAFLLTACLAFLLSAGLVWGAPRIFGAMGGRGAVAERATEFARILFSGLPVTFLAATCDSVLRGEGNVRVPAVWSAVSLLLQIALTPLCMFALGWGIAGAAAAVIAGQAIGLGPRAWYVLGPTALVPLRWSALAVRAAALEEILRVGLPASLGTLLNYAAITALTAVVSRSGTAELAAYGLGSRLDFMLLTLSYGTSVAVLTLVGFASSAGRRQRVVQYTAMGVALVASVLAVAGLSVAWEPRLWLGLFTDDARIVAVGAAYFRSVGLTYPLAGCAMVLAFAFHGLGRALVPLAVVAVRAAGVVGAAVLLTRYPGLGPVAVFVAIAAGNCISAASLALLFAREVRRPTAVAVARSRAR